MKKILEKIYIKFNLFFRLIEPVLDLRKLILGFNSYPLFWKNLIRYRNNDMSKNLKFKNLFPQLHDNTFNTGFDRHYIYHPAWAARVVKKINPEVHIDISSSLHFSTILSAFIPIKFYDYRPANINLSNLSTSHADLLNLPFEDNSIMSLSCMHTIEHIGLGRYGDPIDPVGDKKAINELRRVVSKNGNLILVTPIGKPRLMFNAHRIYSFDNIIAFFPDFEIVEFSLVPDEKESGILENATKEISDLQIYGCGCFWFKKK